MTAEGNKTDGEEKTIPRPEEYTIVKYAEGLEFFMVYILGPVLSTFILLATKEIFPDKSWIVWVVFLCTCILFWIISRRITEVKMNLKITEEGLEVTKLSGSSFYHDKSLIKWENMKHFYLTGRTRFQDFLITVRNDENFIISVPLFSLFEKQKDNWKNFEAFRDVFWEIAPEHDVHRAFFG